MRSETVYLEDARETLPHSAIQVAGAEVLGLRELRIPGATSHCGKQPIGVGYLPLAEGGYISGRTGRIMPSGSRLHDGADGNC